MATRSVGAGNGWSWLKRAVNLGSQNPKALLGAAAILVVIAMLPTFVQMLFQNASTVPSASSLGMQMVFSLLYSVLVMPPAMAGFLRVIHACETGASTRATAIFDAYRQGAGQMIGLVLILMVLAIVVVCVLMFAFGGQFLSGMMEFMAQAQTASTSGAKLTLPQLPDGFGTMMAVLMLFGLFFNGIYALSVGQVALGSRSVGEALRDGFSGTIKNVLPLVVLLAIALIIAVLAGIVLALVIGLVAAIGGMISPTVAMILLAPIYLVLMLAIYVVAFGVMYFMWRDICSDDVVSAPVASDQVEV